MNSCGNFATSTTTQPKSERKLEMTDVRSVTINAEDVAAEFERLAADFTMPSFAERRLVKARAIRVLLAERDMLQAENKKLKRCLGQPVPMSEWQMMIGDNQALRAERDKLRAENERLRANWPKRHGCACKFDDDDNLVSKCQAHREIIEGLLEERDALRKALHSISLGSQNSGTSKEALGREARAALNRKP